MLERVCIYSKCRDQKQMLASTAIEATLQSAYGETPLKIKAASHQQEQKD